MKQVYQKAKLGILIALLMPVILMAQTNGDYRSKASGNWSSLTTWEIFNGTWAEPTPAQGYPGQNSIVSEVTISSSHIVIADVDIIAPPLPDLYRINEIYISNNAELQLSGNRTINTRKLIVGSGGRLAWGTVSQGNRTLSLPAGASLIIEPGPPAGVLVPTTQNCTAAQRLIIGGCNYASCNGGGGFTYSFANVASNDGSLNVSATAAPNPICLGATLQLNATYTGPSTGISFSWTGPNTFTSNLANPTVSNFAVANAGTYTARVNDAVAGNCIVYSDINLNVAVNRLNTWTGATNRLWSVPTNWSCGQVPTPESDVQIPAVTNNPILDVNYTVGFNMNMYQGPNLAANNSLTINPNVTLGIENTTNFGSFPVSVKSDATGTGAIGRITGNFVSGDDKVTVERYIPGSKRRWNLLSFPVTSNTATIRDAWGGGNRPRVSNSQDNGIGQNVPNPSPIPGTQYVAGDATIITGHRFTDAASANSAGFDWWPELIITGVGPNGNLTATSPSSIRPYRHGQTNNTGTGFISTIGINNGFGGGSIVNVTLNNAEPGYLLYTRGDRLVLDNWFSSTTLRPTGTIKKYLQSVSIAAKGADPSNPVLSVVGNPYPAPVNFETLRNYASNASVIENRFWVWDSNLFGVYGQGAFKLITQVSPGNWAVAPSVTPTPNIQMISSSQAILVEGTNAGGTLQFDESVKANTTSLVLPFESYNIEDKPGTMVVNLLYRNGSELSVVDGALAVVDNKNTRDNTDGNDIAKIANFLGDLNIAFTNEGKRYAAQAIPAPVDNDKLVIDIAGFEKKAYAFNIQSTNLQRDGRTAFLKDNFLKTETPIELEGITEYNFDGTEEPASVAPNRFEIVFRQSNVLPVSFTSLSAEQIGSNVRVSWNVATENKLSHYEVEHSYNGADFGKGVRVDAKNTSPASYNWLHVQPGNGNHFYRIRATDVDGKTKLSQVAKVVIGRSEKGFSAYPTIVGTSRQVTLQMELPAGTYNVQVTDMSGRVLQTSKIDHQGGSASRMLQLPSQLPIGRYNIKLNGEGSNYVQSIVRE